MIREWQEENQMKKPPRIEAARCTKCKSMCDEVYICPKCDDDKVFISRTLLAVICEVAERNTALALTKSGTTKYSKFKAAFFDDMDLIAKAKGLI
jgi:hypothetical protein